MLFGSSWDNQISQHRPNDSFHSKRFALARGACGPGGPSVVNKRTLLTSTLPSPIFGRISDGYSSVIYATLDGISPLLDHHRKARSNHIMLFLFPCDS